MKVLRYILLLLCALSCVTCTDEALYKFSGSTQTVRISKLTLSTSDAIEKEISLTRAADQPARLNSVTLFIFNQSGNREGDVIELYNADLQQYTDNNLNDRVYTVSKEIELTVGEKKCYAVANINNFNYLQNAINDLKQITTEAELQAYLLTINPTTVENQGLPTLYETETQLLPFVGSGTLNVVETTGGKGTADGTINLYRPISHITFNVKTSGNNKNFILTNYTVCNVAQSYPVISIGEKDERKFYNTLPIQRYTETDGTSTFEFYIPENIQKEISGLQSYHDRELWEHETSVNGVKDWTNAPPYATYVVISGQYTEADNTGKQIYSGDVSYTIHLGDFSNGQWENFSVERNSRYTYNVFINGVNKIIVEAKKEGGDYQHGAEGIIIDSQNSSQIFDLDCHYEQAYVSYDLEDIASAVKQRYDNQIQGENLTVDDIIGNSFILKSTTPFAPNTDYVRPYYSKVEEDKEESEVAKEIDYKWIYFLSQTEENAIAKYPGVQCESQEAWSLVYNENKYLINPYELCVWLGELTKMIYENEYGSASHDIAQEATDRHMIYKNGTVRFTAFIDENYYQLNPLDGTTVVGWDSFTRQNDRSMLIASNIEVSEDGRSMYAKARTAFVQRSIQTFYNAANADDTNAMGLETYCENKPMTQLGSWGEYWSHAGTSTTDGWANIQELIGPYNNSDKLWSNYIHIDRNGYMESNTSLPEDHFIIGETNGEQTAGYILKQTYPYYACLSRNRDLDGDGNISDDEVRWYLPASDQYLRLSIGADAMSERSRLFWGNKRSPNDDGTDGRIYFTSTYEFLISGRRDYSEDKQVLWAAEVGAFGQSKGEAGLVRCVRNLPNTSMVQEYANNNQLASVDLVNSEANGGVSYVLKRKWANDAYSYIFDFGDRLDSRISRTDIYTGPYPRHTEEGDANKLPLGFVVATEDVTTSNGWYETLLNVYSYRTAIWNGTYDPCANYSEGTGAGAQGRWRVPNLREMMVMSSQAETLGFFDSNTSDYYYIISTDFSGKVSGFAYTAKVGGENRGFITTELSNFPTYVRCVRDMTEADRNGATVVSGN